MTEPDVIGVPFTSVTLNTSPSGSVSAPAPLSGKTAPEIDVSSFVASTSSKATGGGLLIVTWTIVVKVAPLGSVAVTEMS